ncbi:glycosyltransferase family 4 protein [Variovorax sp. LT1P1]|uniref:glycosyltransferase family 4 protein n=1 Tax=Variovorax sp. LT1P1 TaxID=3443730 RepID=UPI003F48B94A
MKILIYSSVFYPAIGGIENLTLALAKEFHRSGHDVKVVTEQRQTPDMPVEGIEIFHSSRVLQQLKLFFWSDVWYMPNITLKGMWLLLFNPFKKLFISHNDFHVIDARNSKGFLKNAVIRSVAKNISVSRSVARALRVKSTVILNCYNDGAFRLYPDEKRNRDFLFVGRLVSQKGCELLLDACRGLTRPFSLSIVGDGVELTRLQALVDEYGLQGSVSFLGFQRDEALARTMNRHRVMIVPSLGAEGFGIVALEGLACGCEMVVSDAGGLPEAVGGFGEVFPVGNAVALRALLDRHLAQPRMGTMSDDKARYLHSRTAKNVALEYLDVFQ